MRTAKTILMILAGIVLAAGTIVEKLHDNTFATEHIYGAWWFYVLLALVALGAIHSIVHDKMWHKPWQLLIYGSVVVILGGGALTAWTGLHGSITLHPGEPATTFTTDKGNEATLPFAITLDHFAMVPYAGTHSPMDFESHIRVEGDEAIISMNNIYRRNGYRFYQEDFDDEGNSVLSVAHDPMGIGVTYAGYIMLVIGLAWMFLSRRSAFRGLLRGGAAAALLLLLLAPASLQATKVPQTLPRATADAMGRMYVLYKGRICPLQTFAKDFTTKLCGSATYKGLSSEQVLSGWLFYFADWMDEPCIKVKGNDVKQMLGRDTKYTSFAKLSVYHHEFEKPHPESKNMRAVNEKFSLIQMLAMGKTMKIYPLRGAAPKMESMAMGGMMMPPAADSAAQTVCDTASKSDELHWYAQNDVLPMTTSEDEYIFVRKQLSYCQELCLAGDYEALEEVFAKTLAFQQKQAAETLPSEARVRAERLYNTLTTGKWLSMLAITLGLLFFAISLVRIHKQSERNLVDHIGVGLVALLTLFLILIVVLRWIAGGHAPMAGGFDSMNLMTIAIGIIGLATSRRYRMAPAIALMTMGFCQLVAMMSGSNPPVTNLMPVLNSPLLTLHVTVIMIAYALFFFVMLNGIAGLLVKSHTAELRRISLLMLYPAVALLAAGIIIGAVWANISWGNYWSWDPKEVWALITLIVYLYPLSTAAAQEPKHKLFHIYCIVAFLSVIITYFGVNLILGGIHAYN